MATIAIAGWIGSAVIVGGDAAHAWGVVATLPLMLFALAAAVATSAVLGTARFVGAAVARETARALMQHTEPPATGHGQVIQFRR